VNLISLEIGVKEDYRYYEKGAKAQYET
jgi:hypothetical protein